MLDELTNRHGIIRKVYSKPNKKTYKYPLLIEGVIYGYFEKDELFRKRILRKIKNET